MTDKDFIKLIVELQKATNRNLDILISYLEGHPHDGKEKVIFT